MVAPVATAATVGVLTLALHLRDPHQQGSWGICPTKLLTGLDCPGCGGLRAVNDLSNGDLAGAASSNLLFVLAIPVLVWLWARWARRAWRGEERPPTYTRSHVLAGQALLAVMVVFAVVRNLPFASWLAS